MPFIVPIANFEEKYQITQEGKVFNLKDNTWKKFSKNPNGYMKVPLSLNGRKEQFLVHRLVALHFLPNPYQHPQVNHIDGNKENNHINNLEWCSREENIQHSLEIGLRKGFIAFDKKLELVSRVLNGELIRDLAKELNRGEESLSGMLRKAAIKSGQADAWKSEMIRRRKNAAIRNLEKINN